jgi:hypothetical protein
VSNAAIKGYGQDDARWTCAACGQALEPGPVVIAYLGSEFTVELMRCPACGLALVPEELALGRMAEVEQLLEDK